MYFSFEINVFAILTFVLTLVFSQDHVYRISQDLPLFEMIIHLDQGDSIA